MKRVAIGDYVVRFVGNKGANASGSAVCSSQISLDVVSCSSMPGGSDASGETVFEVEVINHASEYFEDNRAFSLLAS